MYVGVSGKLAAQAVSGKSILRCCTGKLWLRPLVYGSVARAAADTAVDASKICAVQPRAWKTKVNKLMSLGSCS